MTLARHRDGLRDRTGVSLEVEGPMVHESDPAQKAVDGIGATLQRAGVEMKSARASADQPVSENGLRRSALLLTAMGPLTPSDAYLSLWQKWRWVSIITPAIKNTRPVLPDLIRHPASPG